MMISSKTGKANDRIQKCAETFTRLFEREPIRNEGNDPEFMRIMQRYIFGEIWQTGSLEDPLRALCEVSAMTARHTLPALKNHIRSAFNAGCSARQIREAVYLCSPFTGFPHVMEAIVQMNEVFAEKGIRVPLESAETIQEDGDRLSLGSQLLPDAADDHFKKFRSLPAPYDAFLPHIMTAYGFGDFGSRSVLTPRERELLCVVAVAASEDQKDMLMLHVEAAREAGASEEEIVCALAQASPYMGLPRLLDALEKAGILI